MLSSENNITLHTEIPLYPDNKEESRLTKEEECDYYRQRFNSLKIVLEDFQNQLTLYKDRCRGMSTIQLVLKESRQENVKLSKQVKALERAISILQKRLEKNGLSNSVNIQDAELFVPGASKQTFDNLAKETARLRSLLKQENGSYGKKSADEIEDMKVALEEMESENNELKNKMKDMEDFKLKLVSDYEGVIEKLTKERKEEKENFEKELKANEAKLLEEDERRKIEMLPTGSGELKELKALLIKTVEKCSMLNEKLPTCVTGTGNQSDDQAKGRFVSQEDYDRLEFKHQEAMAMNQKWQLCYNDKERQIQTLNDMIKELVDPHQMNALIEEATNQKTAQLNSELNHRNADILELRKQVNGLSKDLADTKKHQSQMHQDNSTVEILKQQIQVCTEDFNTERKDREQAVQKARALQDDNNRLCTEITSLKRQVEQSKKSAEQQPRQQSKPPSYEASLSTSSYSSESSPPPQYNSQFSQNSSSRYPYHQLVPVQESPAQSVDQVVAMPFSDYTASSTSNVQNPGHRSPVSHSDVRGNYSSMSRQATSNLSGSSTPPLSYSGSMDMRQYANMTRLPAPYVPGSSNHPVSNSSNSDMRNYASMSRSAVSSHPSPPTPPLGNTSMPPLMRRCGVAKEEITCPKCNRKFSDDVLLSHIEACTL